MNNSHPTNPAWLLLLDAFARQPVSEKPTYVNPDLRESRKQNCGDSLPYYYVALRVPFLNFHSSGQQS
jgi:hypothetical protein